MSRGDRGHRGHGAGGKAGSDARCRRLTICDGQPSVLLLDLKIGIVVGGIHKACVVLRCGANVRSGVLGFLSRARALCRVLCVARALCGGRHIVLSACCRRPFQRSKFVGRCAVNYRLTAPNSAALPHAVRRQCSVGLELPASGAVGAARSNALSCRLRRCTDYVNVNVGLRRVSPCARTIPDDFLSLRHGQRLFAFQVRSQRNARQGAVAMTSLCRRRADGSCQVSATL